MSEQELESWRKVKLALEASGKTSSMIYVRACEVLRKHAPMGGGREMKE